MRKSDDDRGQRKRPNFYWSPRKTSNLFAKMAMGGFVVKTYRHAKILVRVTPVESVVSRCTDINPRHWKPHPERTLPRQVRTLEIPSCYLAHFQAPLSHSVSRLHIICRAFNSPTFDVNYTGNWEKKHKKFSYPVSYNTLTAQSVIQTMYSKITSKIQTNSNNQQIRKSR